MRRSQENIKVLTDLRGVCVLSRYRHAGPNGPEENLLILRYAMGQTYPNPENPIIL